MTADSRESHAVEFTPKDGFVYFSDVNAPIDLEVNLPAGKQTLGVTMDFGDLLRVRISRDGVSVYEGETVFTADLDMDIPESGAYTLTLSGTHASGTLRYDPALESSREGTFRYDA